jgi:hypothetical protein
MKKEEQEEVVVNKQFMDLENKLILVRIGDENHIATRDEIIEMEKKLEEKFEENGINCIAIVTHHATTIEIIEKK